ncbi:hypothetical protein D9757_011995 [Collybiopsis confluens]|uniref:Aminopeptidase P N-terminal domain-containing protein n=1 Tax=Collybiopsis confluens TaxID=2823264 RepID=A0A8H5GR84_9AGAR|nr:hypothetical protein D9757_011995 [Collybiopsis confluens]
MSVHFLRRHAIFYASAHSRSYATEAHNIAVKPSVYGQPLFKSHPHLTKPDEITPGITTEEYDNRRRRLINGLPDDSVVVSVAGSVKYMSGNIFYKFRQASDFWYLTGFEEPESAVILEKTHSSKGYRMTLFSSGGTDASKEQWDGASTTFSDVRRIFQADEARHIEDLPGHLRSVLQQYSNVYVDAPPVSARTRRGSKANTKTLLKYLHGQSDTDLITESLGRIKPKPLAPEVSRLRAIKSLSEQRIMRKAADISGRAHAKTMRFTRHGLSEGALATHFDYMCSLEGAQRLAYVPVVASGPNALIAELREVPVAYKTWGTLNEARDNVMIICHAFTSSADDSDWWGPLMGSGKAFDPRRYFVFCANVLGSPYGTASPISINPDTGKIYGPDFPPTSIRDDSVCRLHKLVLDHLGVNSVAVVIGGSMGGMAVLEWPLCTAPNYAKHIIPLATSARHSAWCISLGEAQRQSIYSDPGYLGGYYTTQPSSGLAAARMSAMLTYRSRDSFESRFGRKAPLQKESRQSPLTPPGSPKIQAKDDARVAHNDGYRNSKSYLRYQGDKFIARFDANCYIHITRKLDTHDVARDRALRGENEDAAFVRILSTLPARALVINISTHGLFTPSEQKEMAAHIPGAELVTVQSPDGHDGFLLEFEQINTHIMSFLKWEFPRLYEVGVWLECVSGHGEDEVGGFEIEKTSLFGEAEADITHW